MLYLTVPPAEYWDSEKQEFVYTKEAVLQLEHSLVSISKWEAKWHKPYHSKEEKTTEEVIDYVRCMTVTQNVPPYVYNNLTNENIKQIHKYIDDPMTATTVYDGSETKPSKRVVTSEQIYAWMISYGIPAEFQKWHLNRLLTLIRVCGAMNRQPKKLSREEALRRNAALNAKRRKARK